MRGNHLVPQLLNAEQKIRTAENLHSAAYLFASACAELLNFSDVYLFIPGKSGKLKIFSSLHHPIIDKASVSVQWVNKVGLAHFSDEVLQLSTLKLQVHLDEHLSFPAMTCFLPTTHPKWPVSTGAIIGFRDTELNDKELLVAQHLMDIWTQTYLVQRALTRAPWKRFGRIRSKGIMVATIAVVLALSIIKTPVSTVAPFTIESSQTSIIAPLFPGIIDQVHVTANQLVTKGDVLVSLDSEGLAKERLVKQLQFELLTAERGSLQNQGLTDPSVSVRFVTAERELALLQSELEFLDYQLTETQIKAQRDGVILFDDRSDWERRSVDAGEPIMRLVAAQKLRANVTLPADNVIAIDFSQPIKLSFDKYLFTTFLTQADYIRPDPVQDGALGLVYIVHAKIPQEIYDTGVVLGDVGKARIYGEQRSLLYQIVRRPWLLIKRYLM